MFDPIMLRDPRLTAKSRHEILQTLAFRLLFFFLSSLPVGKPNYLVFLTVIKYIKKNKFIQLKVGSNIKTQNEQKLFRI